MKAPKTAEEAAATDVAPPANIVLPTQAVSDCIDCVQRMCTTGGNTFAKFPGTLHVGAQRSFAISNAQLSLHIKSTPKQLTGIRRPSLLKGFTLKQLHDAAVQETDTNFIDALRNGFECTKHPAPENLANACCGWPRTISMFVLAKRKLTSINQSKVGHWMRATGFTVDSRVDSDIFSRTLPDASDGKKLAALWCTLPIGHLILNLPTRLQETGYMILEEVYSGDEAAV